MWERPACSKFYISKGGCTRRRKVCCRLAASRARRTDPQPAFLRRCLRFAPSLGNLTVTGTSIGWTCSTSRLVLMRRSGTNWPAYVAALVASLLLVACAEEDTGPQFATDPRPTRAPTEAAASPSPSLLPTAESFATPTSLTDLLAARGAASAVSIASGNDVWSISSRGKATRLFAAPRGSVIRAIDPSPNGQQVAILLDAASSEPKAAQVVLVDDAGSVVARVEATATASATPVTRGAD